MMFRCSQALAVVLFAVVITVNNVVVAKDMKKSKKTKPFSKPPPSVTSLLRAVQCKSEDFTFIPAFTVSPPDEGLIFSLVGTVIIFKAPLFLQSDVDVDDNGELTGGVAGLPSIDLAVADYTSSCTVTEGTGDLGTFTAEVSGALCETTICQTIPEYGGCTFYQSGIKFSFVVGSAPTSSFSRTASATSGTGVERFGVDGFVSVLEIGGSFFDPERPVVLDVNATTIIGYDFFKTIKRNVELGLNVIGFLPAEAGGGLLSAQPTGLIAEGTVKRLTDPGS